MSTIDEANTRKEVVKNFASETTMHGLKFLFARGLVRNIIWFVLLLGSCGLVYIQVYQQFKKYLAADISTQIDVSYPESLPFPSVMICNSNMFRISKVYQIANMYEMITDVFARKKSEINRFSPPDFNMYNETMSNLTVNFNGNATSFMQRFGHDINDMLLNCTNPRGSSCDATDFKLQMTNIGPCYVYNATLDIHQSGSTNALTLYINLQAYEAMKGPSQLSSLKVITFDHHEYPIPTINAIDVAPGYMSVIGLKYITEQRLTSCIDKKATKHFTKDQYSAATCQMDNMLSGVENNCSCSPHFTPQTNITVCNISSYFKCVMFFNSERVRKPCNESCETRSYITSLALAKISNNVMISLEDEHRDTMLPDFTAAVEASSRKDTTVIKKLRNTINAWKNSINAAVNFGFWPNVTSVPSIRDKLKTVSKSYENFAATISSLVEAAKNIFNSPSETTSQNGACNSGGSSSTGPPNDPPSSLPRSSEGNLVSLLNPLNGYKLLMSYQQRILFEQNYEENSKLTINIFNGWLNVWLNLLTNPSTSPFSMNFGNFRLFTDMMNNMEDYMNWKITTKQWASNQTKYSGFLQAYVSMCMEYPQSAFAFYTTLETLSKDNLTQTIFEHLNEIDIENSPFWLTVNFASSALFQSPIDYYDCHDAVNMTLNLFTSCFNSNNGSATCSNCSIEENLNVNGSCFGPGHPSQLNQAQSSVLCCSLTIVPTNKYYFSFFKSLQLNLDMLMIETKSLLMEIGDMCINVENTFIALNTELQTYNNQWNWGDDFYSANFLGVQIYFSELSKQTITQRQPYDFFCLICDIGGTLGLFLGASILTFFEVIDMCLFGIFLRKTTKRVR